MPTKIHPWPPRSLPAPGVSPCQRSAMNPGCMLLFVFGFVGGAVVINSAILVSLSVLLLVHFSISTGVPALTQNLPRILRYSDPLNLGCSSSRFFSAFFPFQTGRARISERCRPCMNFRFCCKCNIYEQGYGSTVLAHCNLFAFCLSTRSACIFLFKESYYIDVQ